MFDRRFRFALVAALAPTACVFPATEPTGVEFSWRFFEANVVDGDEAVRVRSCDGAAVETIAIDISDDDAQNRQGIFRFPCADGYQTLAEFQTEASDAFVELRPGPYTADILAIDPGAAFSDAEFIEERMIDVAGRQITTEPWEIVRAPVQWSLALTGATSCTEVAFALFYDDTAAQLPELPDEAEADVLLYREQLVSSGGELRFDGTKVPCAAALDTTHIIPDIDRGAYLLEVTVDGSACAVRVGIGADDGALPLDLAQLPCGG